MGLGRFDTDVAGRTADRTAFITASPFSAQAVEVAKSVERIGVVDDAALAELTSDWKVGVSLRPMKATRLDSDFFEG